jgi:hypothetical protein
MAFSKRGKGNGMETGSSKLHEQTVFRHIIREAPARSLQPHIRGGSAVSHNPVMDTILPGNQGCT